MMAENKDAETGETHAAPEGTALPEGESRASGAPELPENDMSFAELFEAAEKQQAEKRKKAKAAGQDTGLRTGQVIVARVVGFSHDSVFLDVGA